jgi:hypothetical protein
MVRRIESANQGLIRGASGRTRGTRNVRDRNRIKPFSSRTHLALLRPSPHKPGRWRPSGILQRRARRPAHDRQFLPSPRYGERVAAGRVRAGGPLEIGLASDDQPEE